MALSAGALAGCGGASGCGGSPTRAAGAARLLGIEGRESPQLALVAYSTPKKAFDALTAAFEKTAAGEGVSFSESFGASGAQSRAVDAGQPADVVAFSTTPDVTRLVKDGIVSKSWDAALVSARPAGPERRGGERGRVAG